MTFYKQDSLPLQKHVLPIVDKNRNINMYALVYTLLILFVNYPQTAYYLTAVLK